jgi:ketosteroid isomerase-like protein
VTEVDDFLSAVLPPLQAADKALHDGDPMPRMALWAREDPLTLFGAARSAAGWTEIERTFEWLAERFSGCDSFEYEVLAAGASGDLAYIAGIERTVASIGGAPPQAYALRVTTVFRREDGRWRVVHRHGDPLPGAEAARDRVAGPGDP